MSASPFECFTRELTRSYVLNRRVNGETVVRAYSPISNNDHLGYFELVIKVGPNDSPLIIRVNLRKTRP